MASSSSDAQHPIDGNDWAKAYPQPKDRTSTPLRLFSVEDVAKLMEEQDEKRPGVDYVIIDVRRADCTSMIPGAINLPAHSLYHAAPTLVALLEKVPLLLFHCNRSNGRAPRAAGWFADELQRQLGLTDKETAERVAVLQGGIVAWEERFGAGPVDERGDTQAGDRGRRRRGQPLATVQL